MPGTAHWQLIMPLEKCNIDYIYYIIYIIFDCLSGGVLLHLLICVVLRKPKAEAGYECQSEAF